MPIEVMQQILDQRGVAYSPTSSHAELAELLKQSADAPDSTAADIVGITARRSAAEGCAW